MMPDLHATFYIYIYKTNYKFCLSSQLDISLLKYILFVLLYKQG